MFTLLFLYLAIGVAAGLLAGLLGVGGGLVIVPALAYTFAAQGMPAGTIMQLAVGTSLATIVATSIASVRAHHSRGAVLWPVVLRLTPGIVVGALAGALLASVLSSGLLRTLFGAFEILVAVQMGFGFRPTPHRQLPGRLPMVLAGSLIGLVSALVGIGGGTLTVPFLSWCNTPVPNAVATSAACGLPIALAGALGFIVAGWAQPGLPTWSSGFVYWPAFAGIVASSMLLAGVGARLAHSLPTITLKRAFAVFLAAVGLHLLYA